MKTILLCLSLVSLSTSISFAQVGIGTLTPKAFFNVARGQTVLFGQDSNQVGSENKLLWYASQGAFRAGAVAMGYGSQATGSRAFAMGNNTIASGAFSTAMWRSTSALGDTLRRTGTTAQWRRSSLRLSVMTNWAPLAKIKPLIRPISMG